MVPTTGVRHSSAAALVFLKEILHLPAPADRPFCVNSALGSSSAFSLSSESRVQAGTSLMPLGHCLHGRDIHGQEVAWALLWSVAGF